jgi:nucleotide-binding universal stress UspA family protein
MKKILMAHDLSLRANVALERAVQLADQTGGDLDVFHVVPDDLPEAVIQRRKIEATEVITECLASLRKELRARIVVDVAVGKDYTDILVRADKLPADLIVLGLHREDALRHLVIGSTAERVIGFGRQPVLVVSDRPRGPYRRVLVVPDFSNASRRAAEFALALLPDAEVRLVHASRLPIDRALPGPHANAQMHCASEVKLLGTIKADLVSRYRSTSSQAQMIDVVVCHGPPSEVIRQEVVQFRPDLLAIGVQSHIGLSRAVVGEITEELLAQPPCDLITLHA